MAVNRPMGGSLLGSERNRGGCCSRALFGSAAAGLALAAVPSSEEFAVTGVRLHDLNAGERESVVLIHGLDPNSELNWNVKRVSADPAND